MKHADRVKDSFTTTGTGPITLSGSPAVGYRGISAIGGVGATFGYKGGSGAEWEAGKGTILSLNPDSFSRAPTASSNGGALVNFSAGTKEFICTVTADELNKIPTVDTVAFTTAIPLDTVGDRSMTATIMAGPLSFTVGPNPVFGARVYLPLISDTNTPDLTAFKKWSGSLDWDPTSGLEHQLQFFHDGRFAYVLVTRIEGAVPGDFTAPVQVSAVVANGTPTFVDITMSEAIDPAHIPAASTVTITGHTVSALSLPSSLVLRAAVSAAFTNGEAARTASYTANGTNNLRDLAGNPLLNFTSLAITNNVGVSATGATLTGPTGGAVSVASAAFTLSTTPTGSNITGNVVWTPASTDPGDTFTPPTVTTNNGAPAPTFTMTSSATPGARTISFTNNGGLTNPANWTYTSTAAVTDTLVTLTSLANGLTAGATGEYSGGAGGFDSMASGSGVAGGKKIPSGAAGRISLDWLSLTDGFLTLDETAGVQPISNSLFVLWFYTNGTALFQSSNGSSGSAVGAGTAYKTPAAGLRYSLHRATNGTVTIEESTNAGASWTVLHTFSTTWSGDLYPAWIASTIHQPRASGLV